MTCFSTLLVDVFEKNGLSAYLSPGKTEKFDRLTALMLETNAVMNVTAITDPARVVPLHYADSVLAAPHMPENATVLDVGCGGGFPLLPLAIVRPDLRLTGLDSTEKKVRYVQKTAETLGLANVATIAGRAEELAAYSEKLGDASLRETFDVVISRAVARLRVLDELCLPFVKPGGLFIALKGAAGEEELEEARVGVERLGGQIEQCVTYPLHLLDTEEARALIVVRKIAATPREFPREFGKMKKKPL